MLRAQINSWMYNARPIADATWAISDHGMDVFFLLHGTQKALLIDTGFGLGDLRALAEGLLPGPMPLIVVDTHAHPDHAFGNWQFDEVYAGKGDLSRLQKGIPDKMRAAILKNAQQNADFQKSGLPATFFEGWGSRWPATIHALVERDRIELGERVLEIYELPGHTPGSICLLDRRRRLLFSGDGLHSGHIWMQLDESAPLRTYLASLEHLQEVVGGAYDALCWGHNPDPAPAGLVIDLVATIRRILAGRLAGYGYHSFVGDAVRVDFGSGSLVYDPKKLE